MKKSVEQRNQIFNYLYVIAIIMVVDDHMSSRIGLLSSIFPYNSFYMPLFVFISGYFYKKRGIIENTKHKIKKLLLPYIIWNLVAILVALALDYLFGINWIKRTSIISAIVRLFTTGSITDLNGAAWFIIMLFWVSIIYNIIHYKIKDNKIIDLISTIIYIILGFISIQLCMKGYSSKSIEWLFFLKIMFYIQFFHLGNMFKKYIEKALLKYNKIIICSICVLINIVLICIYGNDINFFATSAMGSFKSWYLPLITSMTGILFYYEIMQFLSKKIGKTKLTDFIARNTLVILETHLLFANIPNFYVYMQIKSGSTIYNDFNINQFINGPWVRYSSNTRLIGFFLGIIGSLIVAYLLERLKKSDISNAIVKKLHINKNNIST